MRDKRTFLSSIASVCSLRKPRNVKNALLVGLAYDVLQKDRVAAIKAAKRKQKRRRTTGNVHRPRGWILEDMDAMNDAKFARMFGLNRATFNRLVSQLDPVLKRDEQKAKNSSGAAIPTRIKLACTLRWLRGGIFHDITFGFKLGDSTFYSERGVLWPTMMALDDLLEMGFPLDDEVAKQKLADEFGRFSNGIMQGAVSAVDGLVIASSLMPLFHDAAAAGAAGAAATAAIASPTTSTRAFASIPCCCCCCACAGGV